jgi:hypothetical protein
MKYQKLYELLAPLNLNECNGNFERMVNERMQALCDIKNCELADLTLREAIGCIEAAQLDFNELTPLFFNRTAPRPVSDITEYQLGALA